MLWLYYNLNSSSTDYFLTHHTLNTVHSLLSDEVNHYYYYYWWNMACTIVHVQRYVVKRACCDDYEELAPDGWRKVSPPGAQRVLRDWSLHYDLYVMVSDVSHVCNGRRTPLTGVSVCVNKHPYLYQCIFRSCYALPIESPQPTFPGQLLVTERRVIIIVTSCVILQIEETTWINFSFTDLNLSSSGDFSLMSSLTMWMSSSKSSRLLTIEGFLPILLSRSAATDSIVRRITG